MVVGPSIVCSHPDVVGYTIVTGNLNLTDGAFGVQAICSAGYEGEARATECEATGPYTLQGCTAIVCTEPVDAPAGYIVSGAANLDLSAGALEVDVECAAGYGPAPRVTWCSTTNTPYRLAGCDRVFCSRSDCPLTQALKPNAVSTLPEEGVAATPEICCDVREGHCSLNANATGNHTELARRRGQNGYVDTYQVACGPGYGLVAGSDELEKQTVEECCERLFCTEAACSRTQMLIKDYQYLPDDGVDVSADICCVPVEGRCGGNFASAENFLPDDCSLWTRYRTEPNLFVSPSTDPLEARRQACCGIHDQDVLMLLGVVALFACFGGRGTRRSGKEWKQMLTKKEKEQAGKSTGLATKNPLFADDEDSTVGEDPTVKRVVRTNPIFNADPEAGDNKKAGGIKMPVGSRVEVVRPSPVYKQNAKGATQLFLLNVGDVLVVQDRKKGKDGVERILAKVDMDAPINKHHHKSHSKSGWVRISNKNGPFLKSLGATGEDPPTVSETKKNGKRDEQAAVAATDAADAAAKDAAAALKREKELLLQLEAAAKEIQGLQQVVEANADAREKAETTQMELRQELDDKMTKAAEEGLAARRDADTAIQAASSKVVNAEQAVFAAQELTQIKETQVKELQATLDAMQSKDGKKLKNVEQDLMRKYVAATDDVHKWKLEADSKAQQLKQLKADSTLQLQHARDDAAISEKLAKKSAKQHSKAETLVVQLRRTIEEYSYRLQHETNRTKEAQAKAELREAHAAAAEEQATTNLLLLQKRLVAEQQAAEEASAVASKALLAQKAELSTASEAFTTQLNKSLSESKDWQAKAQQASRQLEQDAERFQLSLAQAQDAGAAAKTELEHVRKARDEAVQDAGKLRARVEQAEASAAAAKVAAAQAQQTATAKADITAKAKVVDAEKKMQEEISKVIVMRERIKNTEDELAAAKSGDEQAQGAFSESMSSKLAAAKEEVVQWKAKSDEATRQAETNDQLAAVSLKDAQDTARAVQAELDKEKSARAKVVEGFESKAHTMGMELADAKAKVQQTEDALAKSALQMKQKDARCEAMSAQVELVGTELAQQREEMQAAWLVATAAEAALASEFAETEKVLRQAMKTANDETNQWKSKCAVSQKLQSDLEHAQSDVKSALSDCATANAENASLLAARQQADAESARLVKALDDTKVELRNLAKSTAAAAVEAELKANQQIGEARRAEQHERLRRENVEQAVKGLQTELAAERTTDVADRAVYEESMATKLAAAKDEVLRLQAQSTNSLHEQEAEIQQLTHSLEVAVQEAADAKNDLATATTAQSQAEARASQLRQMLEQEKKKAKAAAKSQDDTDAKRELTDTQNSAAFDRLTAEVKQLQESNAKQAGALEAATAAVKAREADLKAAQRKIVDSRKKTSQFEQEARQKIAAAEMKAADETSRREHTEEYMEDLEAELRAVRSGDDEAVAKLESSLSNKSAQAQEHARKWESEVKQVSAQFEELKQVSAAQVAEAAGAAETAHSEATKALSEKQKLDEQVTKLRQSLEESKQQAEAGKVAIKEAKSLEKQHSATVAKLVREAAAATAEAEKALAAKIAVDSDLDKCRKELDDTRNLARAAEKGSQAATSKLDKQTKSNSAAVEKLQGQIATLQELHSSQQDAASAAAAEAAKAAKTAAAKAVLDDKQRVGAEQKSKAQIAQLRTDLQALKQSAADAQSAAHDAEIALAADHAKLQTALNDKLSAAVEEMSSLKSKAAEDVGQLEEDLETLRAELEKCQADGGSVEAPRSVATGGTAKATSDADKASVKGVSEKGTKRLKERVSELVKELTATRQELAAAKAAALEQELELKKTLVKHSSGMGSELQQSQEEARAWKAKAVDEVHALEMQLDSLQHDLDHSVEDVAMLTERIELSVVARTKAETDADNLRRQLDLRTREAAQAAKAAQDTVNKMELQVQVQLSGAERKVAAETQRRENAEEHMMLLETELMAQRSGNNTTIEKSEKSITAKLAVSAAEAHKWKGALKSTEHKLKEQLAAHEVSMKSVRADLQAAQTTAEAANAQLLKLESEATELRRGAEQSRQNVEAAAKAASNANKKLDLANKQREKVSARLQKQIGLTDSELKTTQAELAAARAQALQDSVAYRAKLLTALTPLHQQLREAKDATRKITAESADEIHRLELDVAHLKVDVAHLTEDLELSQGENQTLTLSQSQCGAQTTQLRQELAHVTRSLQETEAASKEAARKAAAELQKHADASKQALAVEATKLRDMEGHLTEIEQELATVRAADGDAIASQQASLTSQIKQATSEARQWEAKAMEAARDLNAQVKELGATRDYAVAEANRTKDELGQLVTRNKDIEQECDRLRHDLAELTKRHDSAQKTEERQASKKSMQEKHLAASTEQLQVHIAELQAELHHQAEQLTSSKSAHEQTKVALLAERKHAGGRTATNKDAGQSKKQAIDSAHRLQDELDHLKIDLEHAVEDCTALRAETEQADEKLHEAHAQMLQLQQELEHKDRIARTAIQKSKAMVADADLKHKQKLDAAQQVTEREVGLRQSAQEGYAALEAELAAAKQSDPKVLAKSEKSMAKTLKLANDQVRPNRKQR